MGGRRCALVPNPPPVFLIISTYPNLKSISTFPAANTDLTCLLSCYPGTICFSCFQPPWVGPIRKPPLSLHFSIEISPFGAILWKTPLSRHFSLRSPLFNRYSMEAPPSLHFLSPTSLLFMQFPLGISTCCQLRANGNLVIFFLMLMIFLFWSPWNIFWSLNRVCQWTFKQFFSRRAC